MRCFVADSEFVTIRSPINAPGQLGRQLLQLEFNSDGVRNYCTLVAKTVAITSLCGVRSRRRSTNRNWRRCRAETASLNVMNWSTRALPRSDRASLLIRRWPTFIEARDSTRAFVDAAVYNCGLDQRQWRRRVVLAPARSECLSKPASAVGSVKIASLNGAVFLGEDRALGNRPRKQAD